MSLPTALGAGAVAYFGWRLVDDRLNLSSDVEMARRLLGLKGEIAEAYKSGMNVPLMWSRSLARSPDKRALVMLEEDGSQRAFTFRDVETESNRVARWLQGEGLKRGDTVALFMENRPEFVISWLGMAKIGVKVAMINTAIKEKGLTHCIKISGCRIVLFGAELAPQVEAILPSLTSELNVKLYSAGGAVPFAPCADPAIAKQAKDAISLDLTKDIGMADPFGYIYTSGTTGLPKAAIILHAKMFAFGGLMSRSFVVSDADVVYTVLPLFHSAGGGLGIGMMMYAGATVVLRKKFSAKVFFEDCTKHKVTVVQYIGELCRYLLATPPGKFDRSHKIRIAIGNGLRPEIWDTFQTRFNIPEIGEFYGATEGNAALVNHCRTKDAQGACGRQGWLMRRITGMKLARFDVQNEQIIRGPDGLCQECALGEPGELLFPIKADDPSTTFAGYNDKAATEKKIIRNAFAQGDAYFMTGDLLSIDAKGFIRFVDRIGDTFRWKGENCSTTEVAEVVSTFPGIAEANVYGVQIPNNQDGRAPAVAVTLAADEAKFDWAGLVKHCRKNLPAYSVPMFVRIQPVQESTATFKQLKGALRSEGVDIAKVKDKILILQGDAYVPLTPALYGKITTPGAKL